MTEQTQTEKLREDIAKTLRARYPGYYHKDSLRTADQILSIPEILIKDPDQSLLENPYPEDTFPPDSKTEDARFGTFGRQVWDNCQSKMLKENWVKVLPKGGEIG